MGIRVDGEGSAVEKDAQGSLPILSPETQPRYDSEDTFTLLFLNPPFKVYLFFVGLYRASFIVVLKISPTNGLKRSFCAILIVNL